MQCNNYSLITSVTCAGSGRRWCSENVCRTECCCVWSGGGCGHCRVSPGGLVLSSLYWIRAKSLENCCLSLVPFFPLLPVLFFLFLSCCTHSPASTHQHTRKKNRCKCSLGRRERETAVIVFLRRESFQFFFPFSKTWGSHHLYLSCLFLLRHSSCPLP